MMQQAFNTGFEPAEHQELSVLIELWAWREIWDQVLSGFAWLG